MIKTLLKCVGRYKSDAIKSIIVTGLEAITEIILPILMAMIIDKGISAGDMNSILKYGIIMAITAAFALFLGIQSGKCAAYASSGFAANLRSANLFYDHDISYQ